jgi:hypothetical protein
MTVCVCSTVAMETLLRDSRSFDLHYESLVFRLGAKMKHTDIQPVRNLIPFLNKRTANHGSH